MSPADRICIAFALAFGIVMGLALAFPPEPTPFGEALQSGLGR